MGALGIILKFGQGSGARGHDIIEDDGLTIGYAGSGFRLIRVFGTMRRLKAGPILEQIIQSLVRPKLAKIPIMQVSRQNSRTQLQEAN